MTLQCKEGKGEPGNRGDLIATDRISHCFQKGSTHSPQLSSELAINAAPSASLQVTGTWNCTALQDPAAFQSRRVQWLPLKLRVSSLS